MRNFNSANQNKLSATQHPKVIDEYLAHEIARCGVACPFYSPHFPNLQISSFGVIPKKGQPGKWRMIMDLSSPASASVNNGISSEEFSMHYIKVDEIIRMVSKYGPGTLMAKFDVETAYHSIAVHPDDRFLF